MANNYATPITDGEYVARVRRHSTNALVPLVAHASALYWQPEAWMHSPLRKFTPWTLADIARVSLITGNDNRQPATTDDLLRCCAAYTANYDTELASGTPDALTNFLLRITSEQDYNREPFKEVSRTAAILTQTTTTKQLQVIQPGWDQALFGCTLSQYVGAGFLAQGAAAKTGGTFNPDWFLEPALAPVADKLSASVIADVVAQNFLADRAWFHGKRDEERANAGRYRRFSFNPLLDRPIVSGLLPDLLVVPSIWCVLRKISPLGVYHAGVTKWGNPFADDLGELFEQYVGRQLATAANVQVHPEVVYDNGSRRSVDWIVVTDAAVILVEVKSLRPTEPIRMGKPQAGAELKRMLAKAYKQINNTDTLIAKRDPEFAHIPDDRPRVGLIVTMEQFELVNASPIQHLIDATPNIPTTIAGSEDIERLVTLQDENIGAFLLDFVTNPKVDGWRVSNALHAKELGTNTVLLEAWDSYEWALYAPGAPTKD